MKNLLVTLVSDQTIPNVQIIKEFQSKNTDYLFISTEKMEQDGNRKWIQNTCNIVEGENVKVITVNQFSFSDIETKLKNFDFDVYDKIIVNLTGGTKVMSLVCSDFFKNTAEKYYVTGNNDEFMQLYTLKKNNIYNFSSKITVKDYLTAYGFIYSESQPSGIALETAKYIFEVFCKDEINNHIEARMFIQSKRKKKVEEKDFDKIAEYLNFLAYKPINDKCLSEKETKYLSGDWFEEYIGLSIKQELNLSDGELLIGTVISKERINEGKNSIKKLLSDDAKLSKQNFNNEMDVMFYYKNKFYSIECKSSIIAYKKVEKNGQLIDKPYNILGETIYKSDSLQSKFGLRPNTTIVTLSDFKTYWKCTDRGQENNKIQEMEELINRANHSNIKLVDKTTLQSANTIFELIK